MTTLTRGQTLQYTVTVSPAMPADVVLSATIKGIGDAVAITAQRNSATEALVYMAAADTAALSADSLHTVRLHRTDPAADAQGADLVYEPLTLSIEVIE